MYLAADDPDAPKTGMPANARVRGMKLEEHMQSVLQGMSGSHVSETPNGNVLSPRTQLYVPSEDPDSPSGYDRQQLSPLDRKLNQRLQVMHTMDAELKLKADVKEMELEPKSTSFGKNSEMMLNLKSSKPGHIFDGDDAAARDDRKISKEVAEENGDGLLDHEVDKERKQRRSWSQGIQDALVAKDMKAGASADHIEAVERVLMEKYARRKSVYDNWQKNQEKLDDI
jgi:hypothetical protein